MKKVLIAVDYNPISETVAEKGNDLAKTLNAQVCLIHVLGDVGFYDTQYPSFLGFDGFSSPVGPDIDLALEMRNTAEDFLEKAAGHLNDPEIQTKLVEGETAAALLQYADEWNADVIVMGTHSHSALEKLFVGTVAEKVIEKTKIPVYLVPVKK